MAVETKLFIDKPEPLTQYPGKKSAAGQLQKILSEIPRCKLFIDAMCGSGLVGLSVTNADIIINDIDAMVIDQFNQTAANVSILNKHYNYLIKRFDNGSDQRVFYFDPPYLFDSRSSQRPLYNFEWDKDDHLQFLQKVLTIKCPVMINHFKCKLYDQVLKEWRKVEYNRMTRAGVRKETLYLNFPQPALLQCYQHVGKNFTHRQQIKRKVAGYEKRLNKLPAQERAAILTMLIEKFNYIQK